MALSTNPLRPRRFGSLTVSFVLTWWTIVAVAVVVQVRRAGPLAAEVVFDDDVNDDGATLRQRAVVSGGWAESGSIYGLALDRGQSGSVTLSVDKPRSQLVQAVLWLYDSPTLTTFVECSSDGARYRRVAADRRLAGTTVDLSDCSDGETVWVRLGATQAEAAGTGLELVVDKIQIIPSDSTVRLPDVSRWLALGLLPAVLWVATRLLRARRSRGVIVVVGLLAAAASVGLGVEPPWGIDLVGLAVTGWWLVSGALLLIAWCATLRLRAVAPAAQGDSSAAAAPALAGTTVLWVAGVATAARWETLVGRTLQPLRPDAITVGQLAARMEYLYDTGFREPLWVWLAQLFQLVAGPSDLSLRLFSLACSIGLLVMTFVFVKRYFGSALLAGLVLLLLGSHGFLIDAASQGLRTELFALALTAFAYTVFVPGLPVVARGIGLCLMAAIVGLTQLSGLAVVVPLLAYAAWRHRLPILVPAAAAVVTALVLTPHLLNNREEHGDPFWSANIHAVWYRNYEFVQVNQTGCEGCPTLDDYRQNSYGGDRTTTAEYIFGMHSLPDVVQRTVTGYFRLYLKPDTLLHAYLGRPGWSRYALYVCGILLLVATPARELLLIPFLSLGVLAFLIPLGIDSRLLMHSTPIGATAIALPIWYGARLLSSDVRLWENQVESS